MVALTTDTPPLFLPPPPVLLLLLQEAITLLMEVIRLAPNMPDPYHTLVGAVGKSSLAWRLLGSPVARVQWPEPFFCCCYCSRRLGGTRTWVWRL